MPTQREVTFRINTGDLRELDDRLSSVLSKIEVLRGFVGGGSAGGVSAPPGAPTDVGINNVAAEAQNAQRATRRTGSVGHEYLPDASIASPDATWQVLGGLAAYQTVSMYAQSAQMLALQNAQAMAGGYFAPEAVQRQNVLYRTAMGQSWSTLGLTGAGAIIGGAFGAPHVGAGIGYAASQVVNAGLQADATTQNAQLELQQTLRVAGQTVEMFSGNPALSRSYAERTYGLGYLSRLEQGEVNALLEPWLGRGVDTPGIGKLHIPFLGRRLYRGTVEGILEQHGGSMPGLPRYDDEGAVDYWRRYTSWQGTRAQIQAQASAVSPFMETPGSLGHRLLGEAMGRFPDQPGLLASPLMAMVASNPQMAGMMAMGDPYEATGRSFGLTAMLRGNWAGGLSVLG